MYLYRLLFSLCVSEETERWSSDREEKRGERQDEDTETREKKNAKEGSEGREIYEDRDHVGQ